MNHPLATLTDQFLKERRYAKQQFERLEPTVAAALATSDGQNTIRFEQIAERRFKALAAIAPLPVEIPLVIGDIVHNLRASLDHLAYDLAVKNGTDERRATSTQFPCFRQRLPQHHGGQGYDGFCQRRLKKVLSVPALNAITSEQPFVRFPTNPNGDPLWLLHELDVIDKHRRLALLRQLWAAQRVTIERPTPPGHRAIRHELIRSGKAVFTPARDGAVLFEVELSAPPGTHFHVETELTLAFEEPGVCDGEQVDQTILAMFERVDGLLDRFENQFFAG